MNDKEKLEKVLEFATKMEDKSYEPIETGKCKIGSTAYMQCLFQSTSFQKVRYFIEELLEDS